MSNEPTGAGASASISVVRHSAPASSTQTASGALPGAADAVVPAEDIRQRVFDILRQVYPAPPVGRIDDQDGGSSATPALATPALACFTEPIPARMLNEFVYCPRLFYYEFVEGLFIESADTLRGSALHARVDQGKGALPPPTPAPTTGGSADCGSLNGQTAGAESDVIHSRSVSLGSEILGVNAKMDLVEVRFQSWSGEQGELFPLPEVCPVDYKAGAPRSDAEGNDLWDTDRMQLGLQSLILRHNGYLCAEGVIYYRATRQRVRLPITEELEAWVRDQIGSARQCAAGPMPSPLVDSPKCVRCSLAPICLPDETRLLAEQPLETGRHPREVRRLMAPRDDRRALYLNTQGLRIGRKDDVLQIKDPEGGCEEARLHDVNHVALFGNCQISTQAVQALCYAEIPITYFSGGGWFYGVTRGHELKNVFLRIEQFRRSHDAPFALGLSRRFVQGKIRNQRTLLMRNHVEAPAATLAKLKHLADKALTATGQEELLGLEGAAASLYFASFAGMLKPTDEIDGSDAGWDGGLRFDFEHRNRRPPKDPVNAMLSLAYGVLAKDCTIAALAVGFDPYVGFYHQPRFGRAALALDLMEEFRPLIAESVVLSCVNNRALSPKDFIQAGQAVNLTATGRKRFFQVYEQRIGSLVTHPVFDYKVSYRRALELQARLLAKALTGEIAEYVPLTTR